MDSQPEAPTPRPGLAGYLDRFVGPGATRSELILQFGLAIAAAIAAPIYAAHASAEWTPLQFGVCALLAFDVVGGIITNATSSAKRWYHRRGQGVRSHLVFVAWHLAHLLMVAGLFLAWDLSWIVIAGGYLLASAALILAVPLYLQRPVALAAYGGAVLMSLYVLTPPVGMEWFVSLFFLKLLIAHLPKEMAYPPGA